MTAADRDLRARARFAAKQLEAALYELDVRWPNDATCAAWESMLGTINGLIDGYGKGPPISEANRNG